MTKKTIISAVLLSAILLASAACGEAGAENTVPTGSAQTDTTTAVETEEQRFPAVDYGGETIMFLTEESEWSQYSSIEIYAKAIDGSLINDTVFMRNAQIEEQFNIHIAENRLRNASTVAYDTILAGEELYDVVMPYINSSAPNAQAGLYLDLNAIDNLHLENPWWDVRANESLRMGDHLYFTTGDISILDNDCTMVFFFNKGLAAENDLESPYTLVKNGKWTIDTLFEMCNVLTSDLNGDDKMTADQDRFGFYFGYNVPHSLYFGVGERIAGHDENGNLTLFVDRERAALAADKILGYCQDKRHLTGDFTESVNPFLEGRLFCAGWALTDINSIRDAQFDFGILPYPKYDEAQKDYCCLISTILVPGVSIPTTNKEPEKAGLILEALAYYSADTLTTAYYDIALNSRYIRDTESSEMLDIIFRNRVYDFGYIYDIGGLGSMISSIFWTNGNFASTVASKLPGAQKKLDEMIESFNNAAKN